MVGGVGVGGKNPIRVQSMITADTRDTEACVREVLGLAEAGCEIVRITAQTRKFAENLRHIRDGVRGAGCDVPLVADIHFKPDAALEAVKWVEKVRVNPGNYADKKRFEIREYSDAEYQAELDRIREKFVPLVERCIELGRSMRIGTNHGSLSDRIMNRHGDTPRGMVESAFEFARMARECGYHEIIFSMKASNPKVMIEAYRLLVARLAEEGADWNYPIHLGVTEAGEGEDGRIKSAIGIGSLLADGIGDTIRVSLTEDSIHEIPVARALAARFVAGAGGGAEDRGAGGGFSGDPVGAIEPRWDPFSYRRRGSSVVGAGGCEVGGDREVRVVARRPVWEALAPKLDRLGDYKPEIVMEDSGVAEIDPRDREAVLRLNGREEPVMVTVRDGIGMGVIPAFRLLAVGVDERHPILLKDALEPAGGDFLENLLTASCHLGALLCDGIGDAVMVQGEEEPGRSLRLAYNVLQAAGARIFKTDYVACPSCGRTLFDLQSTTQRIREATGHLKGVRIAVMGCIVNGPGEMADADFGYVGGAPGRVNLYVGREPVRRHIPEEEAVERLIDLIREHGKWVDPPVREAAEL